MRQDSSENRLSNKYLAVFAAVVMALAALRLCHIHLLWSDEDYHLAAALEIFRGRMPYRDFWYDKPPLSALYYLLIQGQAGWPLRLLDTGYVLAACWFAYRLAKAWWGEAEGCMAALLLAFSLAFYLPGAVIGLAADALMLVPHLAAVYFALLGRSWWAGFCCAAAFLVNVKGLLVLAVCVFWMPGAIALLLAGFATPLAAGCALARATGTWNGYSEQVWRWGLIYARQSPLAQPLVAGLARIAGWLGFHAALAGGALYLLIYGRSDRWRAGVWIAFSLAGVCLGRRFAAHYFVQLLAPLAVVGARGLVLAGRKRRNATAVLVSLALLVPLIRFGPRYGLLAYDAFTGSTPRWRDAALDEDAQRAAAQIRPLAETGDTLFVWGYRPDIYVYTRLISDSKFWDSQPLTGVPADRHLRVSQPIYGGAAAQNRREFAKSRPTWVVDGLGLLNPRLALSAFADLQPWLAQYREVSRTSLCVIYRRRGT